MTMDTQSSKFISLENTMRTSDRTTAVKEGRNAHVPPLTDFEQLATWNATQQEFPEHMCVPQLVAQQAAATPNAVALVAGSQVVTYKELNQRANQLAHFLQSQGVKTNTLVGICLERSIDMVIGLLGILKAGGAYVPFDPSYPEERLHFVLADAQVKVLITRQHLVPSMALVGTQVICLDTEELQLSQQRVIDPLCTVTTEDLAYVIYTSGSTGQPKGVLISHRNLLNLVFWYQQTCTITAADRTTQISSPAFDSAVVDLWPFLTTGASVYIPDEDTRIVATLLRDWLVKQGITVTCLPTPLAESLMLLEWPENTALRVLVAAGDQLHRYPLPHLPFALFNGYGPTESTVGATIGRVFPTAPSEILPPIGRPVANTQIYILDESMRQVPIGEPGELYIGGAGLAKGYLNRPELTAERFIAHPFSHEPGARLYKTGDLARYLPDGQIAFLGRNDHQVKIRGFRIELGEIEASLSQHHSVRQAVVIAREDVPGEKRLVAYLVLDSQIQNSPHQGDEHQHVWGRDTNAPGDKQAMTALFAQLRSLLKERLPDYMIPTSFMILKMLPLTRHGKVDRQALPAPDPTNTISDRAFTAPGTPTEEQVAAMLATLLHLEQVGVDENFFMLGGHSLLATQAIMSISDSFGVDISLRTFFDAPTTRQLSTEIERLIVEQLESLSDDDLRELLEKEQILS